MIAISERDTRIWLCPWRSEARLHISFASNLPTDYICPILRDNCVGDVWNTFKVSKHALAFKAKRSVIASTNGNKIVDSVRSFDFFV